MTRTRQKRRDLLDWLRRHPGSVPGSADKALRTVEREVERHAQALAWHRAIELARERGEAWSHRSKGMHCAEDWAAREFCWEFASDMRLLEPIPGEGSELEFAGRSHIQKFSPDCRERLLSWVHDLAIEEEHRAWQDVMRFTKRRADRWIEEGVISEEKRWELTHSYAEAAMHATELLERDYALHAHARL